MRSPAECRQCAEECRRLLSKDLPDKQRLLVLVMIEIWEGLARDREGRKPADAVTSE